MKYAGNLKLLNFHDLRLITIVLSIEIPRSRITWALWNGVIRENSITSITHSTLKYPHILKQLNFYRLYLETSLKIFNNT